MIWPELAFRWLSCDFCDYNLKVYFNYICSFLVCSCACSWLSFLSNNLLLFVFHFFLHLLEFLLLPLPSLLTLLPDLFQFSASESFKEWQIQKFEKNVSVRMKRSWHALSFHFFKWAHQCPGAFVLFGRIHWCIQSCHKIFF